MTEDARQIALRLLLKIDEEGGYSNVVLDELLEKNTLSPTNRALVTRLVYGVIERRLTLDYVLNRTSSVPVKKMDSTVREILRMGTAQLLFFDKTPAFAVIHEAVELTRTQGQARLTGFVNGVLRGVQRQGEDFLHQLPATDKGLEIRYSCPREIIRAWRVAYGDEILRGLLDSLNGAPPAYIRVNTCRTTTRRLTDYLTEIGVVCTPVDGLPDALMVCPAPNVTALPEEWQDTFYFQDIASQWCCYALGAQPGERIADVCAAPGGKSFTVAQWMHNQGTVEAADLYPAKCTAMENRAKRLGLTGIAVAVRDASADVEEARRGIFDRVICDAPCSGLGVMRRKPEIRYKDITTFADLPAIQLTILNKASALVKPGGVLQYSTCTLRPEENQQVAEAFLKAHPDFEPRPLMALKPCFAAAGLPVSHSITLFPSIHQSDGFFIAGFVRR